MSPALSEYGWSPQGPVVELSENSSWELLAGKNFGRLALSHRGRPDIFPVNYYSDLRTILFRTASGSKLHKITHNEQVAFEVDLDTPPDVWSVVARGPAVVLDSDFVPSARAIEAFPAWVPVETFVYVSITPEIIRGRRFEHHLRVGHN